MKRIVRQELMSDFIITHYDDGTKENVPYAQTTDPELIKEGLTVWCYHDPDLEMQRIQALKDNQ